MPISPLAIVILAFAILIVSLAIGYVGAKIEARSKAAKLNAMHTIAMQAAFKRAVNRPLYF